MCNKKENNMTRIIFKGKEEEINKLTLGNYIRKWVTIDPYFTMEDERIILRLFKIDRDYPGVFQPFYDWLKDYMEYKIIDLTHDLLSSKYKDEFKSILEKPLIFTDTDIEHRLNEIRNIIAEKIEYIRLERDLYRYFGLHAYKIIY